MCGGVMRTYGQTGVNLLGNGDTFVSPRSVGERTQKRGAPDNLAARSKQKKTYACAESTRKQPKH